MSKPYGRKVPKCTAISQTQIARGRARRQRRGGEVIRARLSPPVGLHGRERPPSASLGRPICRPESPSAPQPGGGKGPNRRCGIPVRRERGTGTRWAKFEGLEEGKSKESARGILGRGEGEEEREHRMGARSRREGKRGGSRGGERSRREGGSHRNQTVPDPLERLRHQLPEPAPAAAAGAAADEAAAAVAAVRGRIRLVGVHMRLAPDLHTGVQRHLIVDRQLVALQHRAQHLCIESCTLTCALGARAGARRVVGRSQGKGSVFAAKAVEHTRQRQCLRREGSGTHKVKAVSQAIPGTG